MASNVIAFVGENRNGILDCQSRRFNGLLAGKGFSGHVLKISDPNLGTRLTELLEKGVFFAWGYAGIGAQVTAGHHNLWDAMQVPFISVLADAPFILPTNHHVSSPWVVNGYIYQEWLSFQERHIRSTQVSGLLPMGVLPNPDRDAVPWSEREIRMAFVKTGADPATQRARWAGWPIRLRPVLHDCAEILATREAGPITPLVEECLCAHGLLLESGHPLLFGILHELDTYVRALRANTMARALLPLPVDIFGDGWTHLASEPGRARFHAPIPASELEGLYASTQILVNVTPNFGSGAHERVLRGFAAKACVVSDDNVHSRQHLRSLPSYRGVNWHQPDLADHLANAFYDQIRYDDRLDPALDYVNRHHDPDRFLEGMAELAQLARLSPTMSVYALDAA